MQATSIGTTETVAVLQDRCKLQEYSPDTASAALSSSDTNRSSLKQGDDKSLHYDALKGRKMHQRVLSEPPSLSLLLQQNEAMEVMLKAHKEHEVSVL